jgi:GT2 family glycosyltransferase
MSARERSFLAPPPLFTVDEAPEVTFSVVIAAFNVAPLIGDALESVFAQTVAPTQLIVADDGSSDELERALEPYGSSVKLVRGPHAGAAAARNRALEVATGDFVAVLDADDAYLPERLAALHELAAARPDVDVLGTDAILEVDGRAVDRFNRSTPFPTDDQRTAIFRACFVCAPAVRRSRLLALGGFDETLPTGEDWDLVLRLILAGCPAALVDEPLYRYRLRPGSLTSRRVSALENRVWLLEKARSRPGLSADEERAAEQALITSRRRLMRAEAEIAALEAAPGRRSRALRLAVARGVGSRERAEALRWSISPARAARSAAGAAESAAPWRRAGR